MDTAPGGNNIIDGLLRYQDTYKKTDIIGFINGLDGVLGDNVLTIGEEHFTAYRNLGACEFLGRSSDRIKRADFEAVGNSMRKHKVDGLVIVGGVSVHTDACMLTEYFLVNEVKTNVIVIPLTLNNDIRHQVLQTTLGFDTVSKVYSQLIGNMLTDSASAIKYWYFIRLMGKEPSHLALECALRTHPNMFIISEESAFRGETLPDIV